MRIEALGYKTIALAKRNALNAVHQPRLVRLASGNYDSYPLAQPLPDGAVIVARRLAGGWKDVGWGR